MFDDIQKPHRKHEKKTKWGEHDKFSKSAKKAGKRIHDVDHEDWQDEIRNYDRNGEQVA